MIWNLWSSSCGPCSEYPMGTPKSAVSNGFNPSSQYLSSVAQNPVMPFTGWLRTGFLLWVFWATGQRQRHTSNQNLRVHLHDYCNRIITQYKPVVMEYTAEIYGLSTTLTRSRTPQYLNVHDVHAAQVALFTKRRPRPIAMGGLSSPSWWPNNILVVIHSPLRVLWVNYNISLTWPEFRLSWGWYPFNPNHDEPGFGRTTWARDEIYPGSV